MTARSENIRVSELLAQLTLVNSWPLHAPLPYNYPAWSISVEWAMYLLFPLVMLLHRRAGIWSLVAVVMLGFAALEALLATDVFPAPVANNTPLRALPTFVIGILIALNYARFRFAGGVWIGLAAFVVSTALMTMHVSPYIVIALFSIAVLFTAGGEALRTPALFDNHICRMLGDASYSVYMLHAFILSLAVNFIWKRYGGSQEFPLVYGAVAVGSMVLALSLLTFRYFEKPMRDLISGRRARLARSNVALASQRDPFPLR
jgi:peptidoglycan/LPS O-acetylase OafA/YrhL